MFLIINLVKFHLLVHKTNVFFCFFAQFLSIAPPWRFEKNWSFLFNFGFFNLFLTRPSHSAANLKSKFFKPNPASKYNWRYKSKLRQNLKSVKHVNTFFKFYLRRHRGLLVIAVVHGMNLFGCQIFIYLFIWLHVVMPLFPIHTSALRTNIYIAKEEEDGGKIWIVPKLSRDWNTRRRLLRGRQKIKELEEGWIGWSLTRLNG